MSPEQALTGMGRYTWQATPSWAAARADMPEYEQVLRFAVGSAIGRRSRSWRVWVPRRKSDVYISGRSLGASVKASLHESGTSRFALTTEWVRRKRFQAPEGRDQRLAVEWERPRPIPPRRFARPFTIIVPWDEVRERDALEKGAIVWVAPPADGMAVHFDIVYTPAGTIVSGHPGERSMGTVLVGEVELENTERVFVTALARPMQESLLRHINRLRTARIRDASGNQILQNGMLAFGTEPNPDANDGTQVGILVDITRNQ